MPTPPKPLTRSQQAHVRHYYPMGYGVEPIAHALCIEVVRVRNYVNGSDMPRHQSGGANFKRSKKLPPLPMLGLKRQRAQRPDHFASTGDIKAWDQPWHGLGWRIHDVRKANLIRYSHSDTSQDALTTLAQAYQRKAG